MFWKKKKENKIIPITIIKKVPVGIAKPKYSCSSIEDRMIVFRIVLDARNKVLDYLISLKNNIPLSFVQKHNQINIINELFSGLFEDFLDAPSFDNGKKIEEFWLSAVPILTSLEHN